MAHVRLLAVCVIESSKAFAIYCTRAMNHADFRSRRDSFQHRPWINKEIEIKEGVVT